MRILIVLTFLALATAEWKFKTREEWFQVEDDCRAKNELPIEYMKRSKPEKPLPKSVFPLVMCNMRGLEIWDDAKGYHIDRMMIGFEKVKNNLNNYNGRLLREGLENCVSKYTAGGTASFDGAYGCFNCFLENKIFFDSIEHVKFYEN